MMKQYTFKQNPLQYPRMMEALQSYHDTYPKDRTIYGAKLSSITYEYPRYNVVVSETKHFIFVNVEDKL